MDTIDFAAKSNEDLAADLTAARETVTALFALTDPTIKQVDETEALIASIRSIEGEQATRAAAVKDAEARFAAAKTAFSTATVVEPEAEAVEETTGNEDSDDEDETTDESTDSEENADDAADAEVEAETAEEATVTASVNHTTTQKISAAKAVAAKVKRPTVKAASPVTITAAADVAGFGNGQTLTDMDQVTKALMSRAGGFAKFNLRSAQATASQSGGQPVLNKFGVASFGMDFDPSLVASGQNDYAVVRSALRKSSDTLVASMAPGADPTLTAAGWCAPSETVYSYIADYVVDGLVTVPEISAPRGGINITTGPARSSQGAALTDFGFTQTEAQAEAQVEKTCETIVCPDFTGHRLDAIGYCYKIPLLTQKAYPELITDALKFAGVLYAHKVNARVISDMVGLSDTVTFSGYGPSFSDTLEALSIIAVKERRKYNLGRNAVMQVKVPEWVREVLRMDISRRNGITVDAVSDGQIDANFSVRNLAVEYVADWQELTDVNVVLPGTFKAMMFPAGTFAKAVEDVINMSAVYDAASLTINEYTGVFFEQGIVVVKTAYASKIVTVPVNTAGEMGALVLTGIGDAHTHGSF